LKIRRVNGSTGEYLGKALIISSGGHAARLEVPGEEKFVGRGVAYCAMCEGIQFKDNIVAVVGG